MVSVFKIVFFIFLLYCLGLLGFFAVNVLKIFELFTVFVDDSRLRLFDFVVGKRLLNSRGGLFWAV